MALARPHPEPHYSAAAVITRLQLCFIKELTMRQLAPAVPQLSLIAPLERLGDGPQVVIPGKSLECCRNLRMTQCVALDSDVIARPELENGFGLVRRL
ncbi:hypothetical protein NDU88_000781 [Pleurodeles waltl]|uniref:Uncharacterized protein n=1 Tax=Pleurodeles waltl TaxID=8319 RepID=A0AAV7VY99_PLEWA|nr:hypothetical protein NDU88_000781 [Pleurodeles waltl]